MNELLPDHEPLRVPENPPGRPARRSRWPFLLIGLGLGLILSLAYAWLVAPVQLYDTDPVDLHPEYKEEWILKVAYAYRLDGDRDRAVARLRGLDELGIGRTVAGLVQRYRQSGRGDSQVCALALLADALGTPSVGMDACTTPFEPSVPTDAASPTPAPSATGPSAPAGAPGAVVPTATPAPAEFPTATPTPTLYARSQPTVEPIDTPTDTVPPVTVQPTPVPVDTPTHTLPPVTAQPTRMRPDRPTSTLPRLIGPVTLMPIATPTNTQPAVTAQPQTPQPTFGRPIIPFVTLAPPVRGG